jgi:hypothetical protein
MEFATSPLVKKTIPSLPASVYVADMLGGNMKFNGWARVMTGINQACVAFPRRWPEASAL